MVTPGKVTLALAALLLAACAAPREAPQSEERNEANRKLQDAAIAPLNDLNLVRAPIPAALAEAQKAPYALPADASCGGIAAEVQSLDAVLGPDLDTPVAQKTGGLLGSDTAGDALIGVVRSTTEGVIPFRGWVRKLTGAERYSNEVTAAITAGTVRRSFLKGLGQSAACEAPASPRR